MELDQGQLDAIRKLKTGSVLCGGTGTGKSRTALTYYFTKYGGQIEINGEGTYKPMSVSKPLYIITTAKKRDDLEWEGECSPFLVKPTAVDSWNNIKKYADIYDAFFIFDEQRAVGYGPWSKTFIRIARQNDWILLSATPGDKWSDYMAIFIANGFYRNKSDFMRQHAEYDQYCPYTKVVGYRDEWILQQYQDDILVDIAYERHTVQHHINLECGYDKALYKRMMKERWDVFKDEPIVQASGLCYVARKIANTDTSRTDILKQLLLTNKRVIVFYNFDYELDILRQVADELHLLAKEWNGHKHEQIPNADSWVYFVNYSAGSEGWNCITTNVMIFFSQNYSYRTTEQAVGRIDRRNTKYTDLYYYHLISKSPIDRAIERALRNKQEFNERRFTKNW